MKGRALISSNEGQMDGKAVHVCTVLPAVCSCAGFAELFSFLLANRKDVPSRSSDWAIALIAVNASALGGPWSEKMYLRAGEYEPHRMATPSRQSCPCRMPLVDNSGAL